MKKERTTKIRKAVCIMANELRKGGLSLSAAFKKAWRRVRETMTVRAAGTSFENRQERLQFLAQFSKDDLAITLEREQQNRFDANAIGIVVHIKSIRRRTLVGYVPKGLANELAKVLDAGITAAAELVNIIGGYDYKENYGVLLNIAI